MHTFFFFGPLRRGLLPPPRAAPHAAPRAKQPRNSIRGGASGRRVPGCENAGTKEKTKKRFLLAVPGFEPGSSGSQPLMLTTTLYHRTAAQGGTAPTISHWLSLPLQRAVIAQLGER